MKLPRVYCLSLLVLSCMGLLSCSNDLSVDDRYALTLKAYERIEYSQYSWMNNRKYANIAFLKKIKDFEVLGKPTITFVFCPLFGLKSYILIDWFSSMPMADGFDLKTDSALIHYKFDIDWIVLNEKASMQSIKYHGVYIFNENDIPAILFDKNISAVLTKNNEPISNEFKFEITDLRNKTNNILP